MTRRKRANDADNGTSIKLQQIGMAMAKGHIDDSLGQRDAHSRLSAVDDPHPL
jgi:hypothetical protein